VSYAIKNWSRFQHYADRNPPWIKLYHSLLDDDDFAALDHFAQLLYFKLLLAASRKDNQIPENLAWMATELGLPKRRLPRAIAVLLASGFVQQSASNGASHLASRRASNAASKNASPSRASARSRESETEAETEEPVTPTALEDPGRDPDQPGHGPGDLDRLKDQAEPEDVAAW
jgi:hypothetical protein